MGENKVKSHFLNDPSNDIPNLKKFLKKYQSKLSDDFVMGYYIHLYTDYFWFKYFLSDLVEKNCVTKLNGDIVKLNGNMLKKYMYNDYTNLNVQLIDKYDLDLKIIYNQIPEMEPIIEEIPMDKLNLLLDQMGIIIANTIIHKNFIFNIENIENFVKLCTDLILSEINNLNL